MAQLSQKCQYGLRALFELARRRGQKATSVTEIADVQAIPPRFLEGILSQLRQGGFVISRRGAEGGYLLARDPPKLTVGEVIRFLEGPLGPVSCLAGEGAECALYGRCSFMGMWERARVAVAEVYDSTTFADLVAQDKTAGAFVPNYCI